MMKRARLMCVRGHERDLGATEDALLRVAGKSSVRIDESLMDGILRSRMTMNKTVTYHAYGPKLHLSWREREREKEEITH